MSEIVEKVRKYVEDECKKPTSKYGYEPYESHFVPMVENAKILAEKSEADLEVVEIASWLHDIGSIVHGRKEHHITGTKIAEELLRKLNYDGNKIELVKKCILNHRGSINNNKESKEERIIADADGMVAFDRIEGLFMASFVFEGLNQRESRKSVREKLENCWKKLSADAQGIIKPKYEAAMLLLKE